jgi:hypothetical protein|uniref:Uncharacterized protein n=1 Tax=Zea mays TaxID=4577 RepID=C4J337_MAIZE|nr:unknown [Zea mays]
MVNKFQFKKTRVFEWSRRSLYKKAHFIVLYKVWKSVPLTICYIRHSGFKIHHVILSTYHYSILNRTSSIYVWLCACVGCTLNTSH